MSTHRTTFRSIVLAIVSAAFGAALLAGPAGARPVEGPLGHAAHQVVVASAPGAYHDSIASGTGATAAYHDSISTTGPGSGDVARVAPPTSADSVYRDGSAGPVQHAQRPVPASDFRGFGSDPKVLAATTHSASSGSSVSGSTWAAIGGGLLLLALIGVAAAGLGRRSRTPRRQAHHTPSFGA